MKFIENLERYEAENSFSRADIIELTEITEDDIKLFEKDCHNEAMYRFCFNLELDFASIYSEDGFQPSKVTSQWNRVPDNYKPVLTRRVFEALFNALDTQLDSEKKFKTYFTEKFGSSIKISRFMNGKSAMTLEELASIRDAASKFISTEEFDYLVAVTMWSRIPGMNIATAKSVYKIVLPDLSAYLGLRRSSAGNWVGSMKMSLPNKYIEPLGTALGGYSYTEFATTIIDASQFDQRKCAECLLRGARYVPYIPDPVSDGTGSVLQNVSVHEAINILDVDPVDDRHAHLETPDKVSNVANHVEPESRAISTSDSTSFKFNDDRIKKMYNALSPNNKSKINDMITDLFFDQLS